MATSTASRKLYVDGKSIGIIGEVNGKGRLNISASEAGALLAFSNSPLQNGGGVFWGALNSNPGEELMVRAIPADGGLQVVATDSELQEVLNVTTSYTAHQQN